MIEFISNDVPFHLEDADKTKRWLNAISQSHDRAIVRISYVFCSDDYVLELNKKFLQHDYLTDILTFPYRNESGLEADIFISIPRVTENAQMLNRPITEELHRVIIHGLLHLLGYQDTTEEQIQIMRQKENEALILFAASSF